jgi:hypothetical protein
MEEEKVAKDKLAFIGEYVASLKEGEGVLPRADCVCSGV